VTGEQVELVLDDEKSVMACLHLDENGRCAIYASRPRGCRLFECDRMRSSTRDMRLSVESMPACFRMLRGDG
jgi:Fe-S-cluster containining protein